MRLRRWRLGSGLRGCALGARFHRVCAERAAIGGEGELLLYRTEGLGAHLLRVRLMVRGRVRVRVRLRVRVKVRVRLRVRVRGRGRVGVGVGVG